MAYTLFCVVKSYSLALLAFQLTEPAQVNRISTPHLICFTQIQQSTHGLPNGDELGPSGMGSTTVLFTKGLRIYNTSTAICNNDWLLFEWARGWGSRA